MMAQKNDEKNIVKRNVDKIMLVQIKFRKLITISPNKIKTQLILS